MTSLTQHYRRLGAELERLESYASTVVLEILLHSLAAGGILGYAIYLAVLQLSNI